jgi:catechol 2,3-dioxygenase-like lactoylglutathione lyase family enzyme
MKLTTSFLLAALLAAPVLAAENPAPAPVPPRPRITGVSHAAFFVSDMAKARAFYEGFLGFASPFSIPRRNPEERLVWIKINDRQSVELFPGSEVAPDADRLYHIAVEVEDCDAMLAYLRAKGVAGLPPGATAPLGRIGNKNFTIKDPAGNGVEFTQYLPDGWTMRERGKFLPDTRVAKRLSHVGVMTGELEASMKFYRDLLGFQETWRGSSGGKTLNWVNLRVPDGEDYVEFMLYDKYPTTDRLRTMHHICLEVDDAEKAGALLATRPYPAGNKPPTELKVGVNGKRQINDYDSDGTRVEIMEPATADGQPRPPSPAPAPVSEPKPVARAAK